MGTLLVPQTAWARTSMPSTIPSGRSRSVQRPRARVVSITSCPTATATLTLASRTSLLLVLTHRSRGRLSWLLLSRDLTCQATPLPWVLPLSLLAHVVGPTRLAQPPPPLGLVVLLSSCSARSPTSQRVPPRAPPLREKLRWAASLVRPKTWFTLPSFCFCDAGLLEQI